MVWHIYIFHSRCITTESSHMSLFSYHKYNLVTVTATLVAKESAKQSTDGVQDAVGQAMIVGLLMAFFGSSLLLSKTEYVLSSVLHGMYVSIHWFVDSFNVHIYLILFLDFNVWIHTF